MDGVLRRHAQDTRGADPIRAGMDGADKAMAGGGGDDGSRRGWPVRINDLLILKVPLLSRRRPLQKVWRRFHFCGALRPHQRA